MNLQHWVFMYCAHSVDYRQSVALYQRVGLIHEAQVMNVSHERLDIARAQNFFRYEQIKTFPRTSQNWRWQISLKLLWKFYALRGFHRETCAFFCVV